MDMEARQIDGLMDEIALLRLARPAQHIGAGQVKRRIGAQLEVPGDSK